MSLHHIFITGLSSVLVFIATVLLVVQLLESWDTLLKWRFAEPSARYLQLRMSNVVLCEFLRWWSLILSGVTLFLLIGVEAYPLAITFFFICAMAPPYVLRYLISRRELLLESQLIASATGLANALKAGLSIPQGLKTIADESPAPLSSELQHIVYQFEHGRPLAETLADTRKRLQLEPFTLFCLALEVAVERGGRINLAMERLSSSLREWFRLRRKLSSDTAAGRFAVLIMGLCPAAFIVLFYMSGQEDVLKLFTDVWGQFVLSIIILLICLGVRMAYRIMDIRLN